MVEDNPTIAELRGALKIAGERPIVYQCAYARLAMSLHAGIFLSQACYWSGTKELEGGWFWKTTEEWQEETYIGREAQEAARRVLRKIGVLEEKLEGVPARLFFRVNFKQLFKELGLHSSTSPTNKDEGFHPNKHVGNPPNKVGWNPSTIKDTESTTESTPSIEEGWKIFRNTFYRFLAVYPQKNKSTVQKFESAFRRLGGNEFISRMRAWLAATADDYKRQGTKSYAAKNFLDEVDSFEPSSEPSKLKRVYPEAIP